MDEARIHEILRGHERRNRALQNRLSTKVDLTSQRKIDLHFWCPNQTQAGLLADALRRAGFSVETIRPAIDEPIADEWNLEASKLQSIDETISALFVESMTRNAATFECTFDGWGTKI